MESIFPRASRASIATLIHTLSHSLSLPSSQASQTSRLHLQQGRPSLLLVAYARCLHRQTVRPSSEPLPQDASAAEWMPGAESAVSRLLLAARI